MFKTTKQKLLEQQIGESARLVNLLAEHESTYTSVMAEYTALDSQCIPLAARFNAELAAQSPQAACTALELKALRWKREAIKQVYSKRRDELLQQNASLTEPAIRDFIEFCLNLSKETLRLGTIETEKVISYIDGRKSYKVRFNGNRLAEFREAIQAAVGVVRALRDRPLSEVLDRISEFKAEFAAFDTETMEPAELTEMQHRDLTARPEEPRYDKAQMTGSGFVPINPKDVSKIGQLSDRISNLEKNL
jgi:hypothetical protein